MPRSFSILTAPLGSGSPPAPVNSCLAMKIASSLYSRSDRDRPAHGCPDHFFGAARPAQIEPRIGYQDRQVVAAPVASCLRTRRASSDVVFSRSSCLADVVKNAKPRPTSLGSLLSDRFNFGPGLADIGRQFFSGSKTV